VVGLAGAAALSQRPRSLVHGQSEGEQAAQVESRDPWAQPGVVPADAAVGNASVAPGEPGDRPLDHGPVLAVVILEGRVRGAVAVFAQ
jgi:hypothetical protein